MKYAAIDIGSNAIRMVMVETHSLDKKKYFKKLASLRVPLRLGHDAFCLGRISGPMTNQLIKAMQAFKLMMDLHGVHHCMACATSALREARNGRSIVAQIRKQTKIPLQLITGSREAELVYATHIAEQLDPKRAYLYIDIGGGSTELTLFAKGRTWNSQSFNIGTVRVLEGKETLESWQQLKTWIHALPKKSKNPLLGIGIGGNINKIYRLADIKNGKLISTKKISEVSNILANYSLSERINRFALNPDRADVIVPASQIMLAILSWANIKSVWVPAVGLVDGMIATLHERYRK